MAGFQWEGKPIDVQFRSLDPRTDVPIPKIVWDTRPGEALDVQAVELDLVWSEAVTPGPAELWWEFAVRDVQCSWTPAAQSGSVLPADWAHGYESKATRNAPVLAYMNAVGINRVTMALSEVVEPVVIQSGIHEERASILTRVKLFTTPCGPIRQYRLVLRFDTRAIHYAEALDGVQAWWQTHDGLTVRSVVPEARNPVYSTWYSFHQALNVENLLTEVELAAPMGCKTLIIDDGWQTSDTHRGYAYCGDWQPVQDKIPDMRKAVALMHRQNMAVMLWYAVPFVGRQTAAWSILHDKLLGFNDRLEAGVLDPRYPEVRKYLLEKYTQAVSEWDLDGLKLDFIDSFTATDPSTTPGRDFVSIESAVVDLLNSLLRDLRRLKPNILIEFRQSYVGPVMRTWASMLRAGDCPYDGLANRVRTLHLRLLSGHTPVHTDMMMWNPADSVESAALQLVNGLFGIPQISVKVSELPANHRRMLGFWLEFWARNQTLLLDGELRAESPEMGFPRVSVQDRHHKLSVGYLSDIVWSLDAHGPAHQIFINGTLSSGIHVRSDDHFVGRLKIFDCQGNSMEDGPVVWEASGSHDLGVPPAGIVLLDET